MKGHIFTRSIVSVSTVLMLSPVVSAQTAPTDTSRGLSIRYAYLRALLKILRGSDQSTATLREEIAGTSPPDLEREQVRDGFLKELGRFPGQSSSAGLDFATWRSRTIADLEQWLARIVFPKL